MMDSIFNAGVAPGSPVSQTELKTLICYILSNIQQPMSFMQLYDALTQHNLVNYFELVPALDQLCQSRHLTRTEDVSDGADYYMATSLGLETGKELTTAVPASVREKALASAQKVLRRERRKSEVRVNTIPAKNGGFIMEFAIPESKSDLIRFSLFVPTQEECAHLKKRFFNAPLFIYQGVLALLTGNSAVLGEAVLPEEELF